MLEGYVAFLGKTPLNSRRDYLFRDKVSAEKHAAELDNSGQVVFEAAKLYPLGVPISAEEKLLKGYAVIIETNESMKIKPTIFAIKPKFEEAYDLALSFDDGRKTEVRKLILMEDFVVLENMLFPGYIF